MLFNYFLTAMLLVAFLMPTSTFALTSDDLQSKIAGQNSQITALEQEIAGYQTQLAVIGAQKDSLSNTLKQLDVSAKKLSAQIKVTQQKIDLKNEDIASLGGQIDQKGQSISTHKGALGESIKFLSQTDNEPLAVTMLRTESIGAGWQAIDQTLSFQKSVKDNIGVLASDKQNLEDTKTATEKAKADLVALQNGLADQKKILDGAVAEKTALLKQTKDQESNYSALLTQKIALRDAVQKELRDYESQLQYVLNPNLLPPAGSHPLSWPLDSIYVTQFFGKTEAGKRLYVNGTHNGVDFRASIGTPVHAMADGTVAGTGNTDIECLGASFGKFVFIKYDNGLASTFGHLSLIKVAAGDHVSRGETVGYSGNTGYSTGPHLHVSVYARDAVDLLTKPSISCKGKILTQPLSPINGYLDPMQYLPAYSS